LASSLTTALGGQAPTATAPNLPLEETPVDVNERGFMTDLSQWTPGAALFLARRQGLDGWPQELSDDHWRVIDFMRSYYDATSNAPSLRYTCKALGLAKKRFSRLFPGGLRTVRRISGLPGPRRAANRRELSIAQQLLARNWWEQLTQPDFRDRGEGRTSRVLPAGVPGQPSTSKKTGVRRLGPGARVPEAASRASRLPVV
jgi:TusE/DsrC/DsvC family sulfur relay protein